MVLLCCRNVLLLFLVVVLGEKGLSASTVSVGVALGLGVLDGVHVDPITCCHALQLDEGLVHGQADCLSQV